MLNAFTARLLTMSLSASAVILVVLAARLLLKKSPKIISYALWGVVLLRLLCPFSFENPVGLLPARSAAVQPVQSQAAAPLPQPVPAVPSVRPPEVQTVVPEAPEPLPAKAFPAGALWLTGALLLAGHGVWTYGRLRRRLVGALRLRDNIWLADGIDSPFVLGLVRPKIYLPSALPEKEQGYILAHEQHHIRRGDPVFKALAFAALCLHWFNPLVWLAFFLVEKDMEMSCDEAVIRQLGSCVRADYAASLLRLATGHRVLAGTPLAFGEGSTKSRIENLARWKQPALWAVLAAVLLAAVLGFCLLGNRSLNTRAIQVAGIDFLDAGTTLDDLPETAYNAGFLFSNEPHSRELPRQDFHGVNLPPRYSGQPLYRDEAHGERLYLADNRGKLLVFEARPLEDPQPLTPEDAGAFVQALRDSLKIQDEMLLLEIPSEWPAAPGTEVLISLAVRYTDGEREELMSQKAELGILQNTGYNLAENTGRLESAELTVRFSRLLPYGQREDVWDSGPILVPAAVLLGEEAPRPSPLPQESPLTLTQDGTRLTLSWLRSEDRQERFSVTLPQGVTARVADGTMMSPSSFPTVLLLAEGAHEAGADYAGSLDFYEFAAAPEEVAEIVDPAENRLPMPIMAGVALDNHVSFENYTVQRSTETGAAALADYGVQQLGSTDAAASDPWVWYDAILGYRWDMSSHFAMLTLTDGMFTPEERAAMAGSMEFGLAIICTDEAPQSNP